MYRNPITHSSFKPEWENKGKKNEKTKFNVCDLLLFHNSVFAYILSVKYLLYSLSSLVLCKVCEKNVNFSEKQYQVSWCSNNMDCDIFYFLK